MANLVHEMDRTIRTLLDLIIVPDHTPKTVGDHLPEHRVATTAQAHTPRDLATAKAMARILIDPTIPKAKVRPRMIRVRTTEKVKVVKVKDAGGNILDMLPQPLPTLKHPILRPYQMGNNRSKNGNLRISTLNTCNARTMRYIND